MSLPVTEHAKLRQFHLVRDADRLQAGVPFVPNIAHCVSNCRENKNTNIFALTYNNQTLKFCVIDIKRTYISEIMGVTIGGRGWFQIQRRGKEGGQIEAKKLHPKPFPLSSTRLRHSHRVKQMFLFLLDSTCLSTWVGLRCVYALRKIELGEIIIRNNRRRKRI